MSSSVYSDLLRVSVVIHSQIYFSDYEVRGKYFVKFTVYFGVNISNRVDL